MPLFYIGVALVLAAAAWWLVNTKDILPQGGRTVVNIAVVLVFVGILLWLINTYVPMAASIKSILNIFVVVAMCVFILKATGLWSKVVALWDGLIHRSAHALDESARKNT
jgi:hypothetical protein